MIKEFKLILWVGVGCQRGTSKALIEFAIAQVFQAHNLPESSIAGLATIDTKANELGIVEFCRARQFALKIFSSDQLNSVSVLHPSTIVQSKINTPSVAEAAAILAAGLLIVPKQIVRKPGESGAVTVAVAGILGATNLNECDKLKNVI